MPGSKRENHRRMRRSDKSKPTQSEDRTDSRPGTFDVLKALADETRYEIYSLLEESSVPMSVQQIAERTGLHPNTLRPHLERLRRAGLVEVSASHEKRVGRPHYVYFVHPRRPLTVVGERAVRILRGVIAETLERLVDDPDIDADDAIELGRRWGRQMRASAAHGSNRNVGGKTASTSADPMAAAEAALLEDLELLGFEPTVVAEAATEGVEGESLTVAFGDCPYRELARRSPELVCGVHRGICDESVSGACAELAVVDFHTIDAGEPCTVTVARYSAPAESRR